MVRAFVVWVCVGWMTQVWASETPEVSAKEETPPAGFEVKPDGYLRLEAATFVPDRFLGVRTSSSETSDRAPGVGRNDGFMLGAARFNLRASYGTHLYVRLSYDGALASYQNSDDHVGRLSTGVRDAYMRYTWSPQFVLFAGRFKPPFDVEELTPQEKQYFTQRSLESRGVMRHEGYYDDLNGFAPGRQLGVMLGGDGIASWNRFKLGYALAVTNGNSNDAFLNDNDLPAVWGRLFVSWSAQKAGRRADEEGPSTYGTRSGGMLGLSSFYNQVSLGDTPVDMHTYKITGLGFDAIQRVWWLTFAMQLLYTHTKQSVAVVHALGGHAQVSLEIPGLGLAPGYRFSFYDPHFAGSAMEGTQTLDIDRVMHHTLGVRYLVPKLPIVVLADYTRSIEQTGRALSNDRLQAAVQVTFE